MEALLDIQFLSAITWLLAAFGGSFLVARLMFESAYGGFFSTPISAKSYQTHFAGLGVIASIALAALIAVLYGAMSEVGGMLFTASELILAAVFIAIWCFCIANLRRPHKGIIALGIVALIGYGVYAVVHYDPGRQSIRKLASEYGQRVAEVYNNTDYVRDSAEQSRRLAEFRFRTEYPEAPEEIVELAGLFARDEIWHSRYGSAVSSNRDMVIHQQIREINIHFSTLVFSYTVSLVIWSGTLAFLSGKVFSYWVWRTAPLVAMNSGEEVRLIHLDGSGVAIVCSNVGGQHKHRPDFRVVSESALDLQ